MLKAQKKLTKKEIKEDKFVEATMQARAYVEDNYKQVSIITAAIFIVFLLIMGYNYVHSQTSERSFTLLGEAQLEYQNMNYTKARTLLDRLEAEYSGTDAADQGLLLLGNLNYQQDKYQEAADSYRAFTDSYSGSDILIASGYAGYAASQEKLSNFEEAARFYLKAQNADPDFVESSNYLYLAALNFISIEDYSAARTALDKIVTDYPDSQREQDAKAQLILLAQK